MVHSYFARIAAQTKLESARRAADEGDRFLQLTLQLEHGGEVAHSDSIKAELQATERRRGLQEAQLGLLNARLDLAVLIFPDFNDNFEVTEDDVKGLVLWNAEKPKPVELPFKPARVILQDFTGVPAVVDLATMRDAMTRLGGDPQKINPLVPVDLVIDHSVIVDAFGSSTAFNPDPQAMFTV